MINLAWRPCGSMGGFLQYVAKPKLTIVVTGTNREDHHFRTHCGGPPQAGKDGIL